MRTWSKIAIAAALVAIGALLGQKYEFGRGLTQMPGTDYTKVVLDDSFLVRRVPAPDLTKKPWTCRAGDIGSAKTVLYYCREANVWVRIKTY